MAGSLSNGYENIVIDHLFRNQSHTPPSTIYVALFTACSSDGNSVTEVSGGSYARTAVTFSAASSGATSNSGAVTFPTPSAGWGTVTHFGIYDASTAGNLMAWGDLTASKVINSGDTVSFASTTLTLSVD